MQVFPGPGKGGDGKGGSGSKEENAVGRGRGTDGRLELRKWFMAQAGNRSRGYRLATPGLWCLPLPPLAQECELFRLRFTSLLESADDRVRGGECVE